MRKRRKRERNKKKTKRRKKRERKGEKEGKKIDFRFIPDIARTNRVSGIPISHSRCLMMRLNFNCKSVAPLAVKLIKIDGFNKQARHSLFEARRYSSEIAEKREREREGEREIGTRIYGCLIRAEGSPNARQGIRTRTSK